MKFIILILCLNLFNSCITVTTGVSRGVYSSDSINVAKIKHHPWFHCKNYLFKTEKNPALFQKIYFHIPGYVDESNTRYLKINIIDLDKFKQQRILKYPEDTAIVKISYEFASVWEWGGQANNAEITGTIKLLHWNFMNIVLKENLKVVNGMRHRDIYYNAVEKFNFLYVSNVPKEAFY